VLLCLAFGVASIVANTFPLTKEGIKALPTLAGSNEPPIPGFSPRMMPSGRQAQPVSSTSSYDEQVGLTFTQDFTSIEYNVTGVEQTDPILGDGPAYLLSGVSNLGYWYQVGLSWDWAPGQNPGTGFNMNYEVYDASGNSVFPSGGQGGLAALSGSVNAGDTISIDLYFSGNNQSVTMLAKDTNTGAVASETYSSMGATYFKGLPGSTSDQNGYFTGLMTEWYHSAPYYANEAEVVYSNNAFALSSAWMWIDEFNPSTSQGVFFANTSAPVSFSNPTRLLEFSFNGTTEYADAHRFVTGSLSSSTPIPAGVPLTLSYAVRGRSGYAPPTLTYISNGTSNTTPLTGSPTIYEADPGTGWNVSLSLNGSTSSERWETGQQASGLASSSLTDLFVYFSQRQVVFVFSISGGGSGFSPPTIKYTSFGSSATAAAGTGVWADSGSRYQYQGVLSGSVPGERWYTKQAGTIGSSGMIGATYYHQYLVNFDISFKNTGVLPGIALSSRSAGQSYTATLVPGTNNEWLDPGADYSVPPSISQGSGDRLITSGNVTGKVSASLIVGLVYEHQFYVTVAQNDPGGGNLSQSTGWYDSGSKLEMDAVAAAGWQFEGWVGSGVDSVSSSSASFSLTVGPAVPANETAVFYPGVTIEAGGPVSVSFSDGSVSGSVPAGARAVVYVAPNSTMGLTASDTAFLTSFRGWNGASNSSNADTAFVVESPGVVLSNSQYDYVGIVFLAMVVGLVAVSVALVLRRKSSRSVLGCRSPVPESSFHPKGATG